jgi:hypothetical protein
VRAFIGHFPLNLAGTPYVNVITRFIYCSLMITKIVGVASYYSASVTMSVSVGNLIPSVGPALFEAVGERWPW